MQPRPCWPIKKDNDDSRQRTDYPWTRTLDEKAEAFASHLESRFRTNQINDAKDREFVRNELDKFKSLNASGESGNSNFKPVTLAELNGLINSLELKKAPGTDNLNNKTIINLPTKARIYLILIYNNILRTGHFPNKWKHASISMIPKPGKSPFALNSYRPISLLSGLSKLLERILLKRLYDIDSFAKAIPSHQFGFRKDHGAEHQLARVTQFILKAFDEKDVCSATFLDITEAFDRVWHDGLLYKLSRLIPRYLFDLLENYLSNRTFSVRIDGETTSRIGNIRAGVPQGSILGPVLYSIYSSDMPYPIVKDYMRNISFPDYHPTNIILATYADDTIILSRSKYTKLAINLNQNYLNVFCRWSKNGT